jgi:hypothetical protein
MTKEKKEAICIKCSEFLGWEFDGQSGPLSLPWRNTNMPAWNGEYWSGRAAEVPAFTEHYDNAAELLIEWMSKPENGGWRCILHIYEKICSFYTQKNEANGDILTDEEIEASADSLPLAICLCFLRANGIDPSTL